jgi:hypothetical protein
MDVCLLYFCLFNSEFNEELVVRDVHKPVLRTYFENSFRVVDDVLPVSLHLIQSERCFEVNG